MDPITAEYPELTPYQFASNNPTTGIDLDGLEFVSPQEEYKKHWYGKAVNFFISTGDDLLKIVGSLTEIPGQMHYGNRLKPKDQAAAFPLTHGQNIKDMALGAVSAPVYVIGGVINDPSNEENWAHLTSNIIVCRGLLKEKPIGIPKPKSALIPVLEDSGGAIIKDGDITLGRGWLDQGGDQLNFTIKTKGTNFEGRGADVFSSIFDYINKNWDQVVSIRGNWKSGSLGDNLDTFNRLIKSGKSLQEAALGTLRENWLKDMVLVLLILKYNY